MRLRKNVYKRFLVYMFLAFIFILGLTIAGIRISFYHIALIIYLIFFFHCEFEYAVNYSSFVKSMHDIEAFLSTVRHRFYIHGMIDEAVCDATEECCNSKMKDKGRQLYDMLNSENIRYAYDEFSSKENNNYLKLFACLCMTVMEYGDKTINEHSLFLDNLKNLKTEINNSILRVQKARSKFSGMAFVAVLPACFINIIRNWGVGNLPELEVFYESRIGRYIAIGIFAASVISYTMICDIRAEKEYVSGKQHFLIHTIVSAKHLNHFLKSLLQNNPKRNQKNQENLRAAGSDMDVCELLFVRLFIASACFIFCLTFSICTHTDYYKWYQLLISVVISISGYYIPSLILLYKRQILKMSMDEEVLQYHSIIMMLMYVERISAYDILEAIENFAFIFKRTIGECLNDYYSGEKEATITMKEKESCDMFNRVVDNFLICDEIGTAAAFDEISMERNYYCEKRKQEFEIMINKKAILGQIPAFIPLLMAIGLYLIIPFVSESLNMLSGFTENIGL